jgi:hypothetical protein
MALRACGLFGAREMGSVAASMETLVQQGWRVGEEGGGGGGGGGGRRVVVVERQEEGGGGRGVQWVFLGCPGVGKGTYASRLAKLLQVPHIAMGDLVRQELSQTSSMAKQVCVCGRARYMICDFFFLSFDFCSKSHLLLPVNNSFLQFCFAIQKSLSLKIYLFSHP